LTPNEPKDPTSDFNEIESTFVDQVRNDDALTEMLQRAPLAQPRIKQNSWDRARIAIKGIGPGPVADQLEDIEALFPVAKARLAIGLLYKEIEILALAYAKAYIDLKAAEIQRQFYANYCKMVNEHRELRAFLYEHFNEELGRATSLNVPLLEICKGIMLEKKKAGV
jgi:hypothetical protein